MFEITPDDIALLNDEDLRTLVGFLCEAEVRRKNCSTSIVTWGGNQNAADGGVDVRVSLPSGVEIDGFVPRPATGFQVKATEMARAEILAEMCPKGVLRAAIRDLSERSGAYVIVSSASSTSDTSLQNRRDAMREAVEELSNAAALLLDFYDRGRLATWIRNHAGLVPWVREKIGRTLQGWRSYGAWAPGGRSGEYLLDDALRIRTSKELRADGFKSLDGIKLIRDRLRHPGKVVRLVGLSGVGKTRLVQALFDDRIGEQSLDPSLAAYTDIADSPEPLPGVVASDLIASRRRAILIVDNCPPELHSRLAELCRAPGGLLSVITVEYDIREDQPEGTDVFELVPSSAALIEKLVKHRFPDLSPVDSRTIAEFSGGNARIAIALAETVGRRETVTGMSNEDLFRRLFQQRHESSESLLLAAQALSLVYSFQGEDVSDGDQAELFRFGSLIGKTAEDMFQCAAVLQRRCLIQKRGVWRAVLPQAIANRLAARALQDISSVAIERQFIRGAPERLIRSFSRRLGYLDSSPEAVKIVRKWLGVGGRLEKLADLDDLETTILINVAPVAPEAVLTSLERTLRECTSEDGLRDCVRFVSLVRSLAWDAALFERCISVLVKIAGAQGQDIEKNTDAASSTFVSLFVLYFSGTHASIDQRLAVVKSLVRSDDDKKRALGLMALRAVLEASHFGAADNFDFGARSRDYGYWPRSREDVKEWFGRALQLAETLSCSDEKSAVQVRAVLAEKFRGLWTAAGMYDDLERLCRSISTKGFWSARWIAVRQTSFYDHKGFNPEISARLAALQSLLEPKDLVQKVQSIVLSEGVSYVGLDSTYDEENDIGKTMLQIEAMARELGMAVALDQDVFTKLLPELIAGSTQPLWSFGGGLAIGRKAPRETWSQLVTHLQEAPADKRNPQVFRGFLNALHAADPILANALLDDALVNDPLAQWLPILQAAVGIDEKGVNRLMRSLDIGKAWIGVYRNLIFGGVTHQIAGPDFNRLLFRIAAEPDGLDIALEILYMRLAFEEGRVHSSASELIDVGCALLSRHVFANRSDANSHRLRTIAKNCVIGEKGKATVREVCQNLRAAIAKSETLVFYHQEFLQVLIGAQPLEALEALCGESEDDLRLGIRILDQAGELRRNAFDAIPESALLDWCDRQPETRYPAVAGGITPFQPSGDAGNLHWTTTARNLLAKAPDPVEVLKRLIRRFGYAAAFGSSASTAESDARLLDQLADNPDPALRKFIEEEKTRLAKVVDYDAPIPMPGERITDERFE